MTRRQLVTQRGDVKYWWIGTGADMPADERAHSNGNMAFSDTTMVYEIETPGVLYSPLSADDAIRLYQLLTQ